MMIGALRFDGGIVDLTEPNGVVLRFRITGHLARMRYGTAILLPDDVIMRCWPPTGEYAPRPYISAADMEMLIGALLKDDGLTPSERPRPETSYTSLERVINDLPDDGSFVVRDAMSPVGMVEGITVYRKLKSCPRCRGSGYERYTAPLDAIGPVLSNAPYTLGKASVTVRERRCDHKPA